MAETNINWQPDILQDDSVKLIPLVDADFDDVFQAASDPLIWEQHPTSDRYKKEVFKQYFDGAISSKAAFRIIDGLTNKTIGSTRFYDYRPERKSIAIGYTFLAREYWGGRYNKSAKKLLLDYAFQYVDDVYFHIGLTNIRSQTAILKIGAVKAGLVDFEYYGTKAQHLEFVISKKDWYEKKY